jgi:hypothetical protein
MHALSIRKLSGPSRSTVWRRVPKGSALLPPAPRCIHARQRIALQSSLSTDQHGSKMW